MDATADKTTKQQPSEDARILKAHAALESAPEFDPRLTDGVRLNGYEDTATRRLLEATQIFRNNPPQSYKPLLPLLFSIKGEPYSLEDYFPFEPYFRTQVAPKNLFIAGRQVAKSTGLASRGIAFSNTVPWFTTLYVTPLFEQIRRFSQNYVRMFIENSPVRDMMVSDKTVNQMLQRTFLNNSALIMNFAGLSADRIRGISAQCVVYDEIQDMDKEHLPVIRECMSGSKYGDLEFFGGTPKGLENTIAGLWNDSAQGEWAMKCHKCGHWNIPSLTHDLEAMIGPYDDSISETNPGVICGKCRKRRTIFPREGHYIYARPSLRWQFAGWHIPQLIMPMHYANPNKWAVLLGKQAGKYNTTRNKFYNEVCGESYDSGSRIITITELKRAAVLPWGNTLREVTTKCDLNDYVYRVVAADWGGGGDDGVSFTKIAVLGMTGDGEIHCIFGYQSMTPHEHEREAKLCMGLINHFRPHAFVHDFNGAGSLRETFMYQAGWPYDRIIPVSYVRASTVAKIMNWKAPSKMKPRGYYQVDKSRSLLLTCNQIRCGRLKFFQYDDRGSDDPGLIRDFVALVDEQTDTPSGQSIFTIIRDPHLSDDFAQAVNMGCCALWNMSDKWPDVSRFMPAAPEAFFNDMEGTERDLNELLASSINPDAILNTQPRNHEMFDEGLAADGRDY